MGRRFQTNPGLVGRRVLFFLVVGVSSTLISSTTLGDEPSSTPKRILLLYHYGPESPSDPLFERGFESVMKSHPATKVDVYREYLETYRFPGEEHAPVMRDYLKGKYAGRKIDVIVALTDTSLNFLLRFREEMFPGVPLVYAVSKRPEPGKEPSLSTGVWCGTNIKDTLEVALQMQPETTQVFVTSGSADNRAVELEAQEQLKQFEGRVRLTYLSGRALDELIAAVKTLPEHSIILYQRQTQGAGGKGILPADAVVPITQAANAPVYASFDTLLGQGIVGGMVVSHEELGRRAARMALQIIQGARPENIPIESVGLVPMFDWRQLKRWGIDEQRLPSSSIVTFRQPSFWELYRWRIIGAAALVILEAILIMALLIQRSRRARAEDSRRLSEEKFSKAFRSSPDAFVIARSSDGVILEVNERWQDLLGYSRADAIGRTTLDLNLYAVPSDREKFRQQQMKAEFVRNFETDIRTRSGEIKRAVLSAEKVVINDESCLLVIIRDVTEHRNSERALQKMTGQLISLRDEEQRRIAGELHDGLGQSLVIINNRALIGMRDATDPTRATEQFEEISFAASSAIDEVREIAYNLRPHELGKLGLVQAIRSMVTKVSHSSPIRLSTDLDELNGNLSVEAETSIYRVVQEALNNVVKHAEATEAHIALKRNGNDLVIKIVDNGKGITQKANGDRTGFGLVGIAERARMLGGSCVVESTPLRGTVVTLSLSLFTGEQLSVH